MQNQKAIDFSSLKLYSKLFLFFRTVKRFKMILVRAIFFLIVLAIAVFLVYAFVIVQLYPESLNNESSTIIYKSSYESNESGEPFNLLNLFFPLLALYFGPTIMTLFYMGFVWKKFAFKNGFTLIDRTMSEYKDIMNVPSFRGKLITSSVGPIAGDYDGKNFALFTRQYKEGGILRWRERQMDTILTLFVPADLPHIVINAKANERARRSNLSTKFDDGWRFKFEGTQGEHYEVYTAHENRIVALQLFTPDVLDILYSKLPTTDIELKGDKIWFVQRYCVLDDQRARNLYEAVGSIESELRKQIESARLTSDQT